VVEDAELREAVEQSPYHMGLVRAQTAKMQQRYKQAISMRLVPKSIDLVTLIAKGIGSGSYREAITVARRLVSMMERISED
jgi:uncharacterized membrane protein YukC